MTRLEIPIQLLLLFSRLLRMLPNIAKQKYASIVGKNEPVIERNVLLEIPEEENIQVFPFDE